MSQQEESFILRDFASATFHSFVLQPLQPVSCLVVTFTWEAIKSALEHFRSSAIFSLAIVSTMQLHLCESFYDLKKKDPRIGGKLTRIQFSMTEVGGVSWVTDIHMLFTGNVTAVT